jgi:hypothetical protein
MAEVSAEERNGDPAGRAVHSVVQALAA